MPVIAIGAVTAIKAALREDQLQDFNGTRTAVRRAAEFRRNVVGASERGALIGKGIRGLASVRHQFRFLRYATSANFLPTSIQLSESFCRASSRHVNGFIMAWHPIGFPIALDGGCLCLDVAEGGPVIDRWRFRPRPFATRHRHRKTKWSWRAWFVARRAERRRYHCRK